ncbi:MAG: hypothetical protein R2710_20345 [Acidimicrobiales bacterium]
MDSLERAGREARALASPRREGDPFVSFHDQFGDVERITAGDADRRV